MNIWHDIDPERIQPDLFTAVVEIPKDGKVKYELDKPTGMIIVDRILSTATRYPANYGFIPLTLAYDHDPLDVMVLCSEPLRPLSLIQCRPIGMLIMIDGGDRDEKIVCVSDGDPIYRCYRDVSELPGHIIEEMRHFFSIYKALENKKTEIREKTKGREEAIAMVAECIENYKKAFQKD